MGVAFSDCYSLYPDLLLDQKKSDRRRAPRGAHTVEATGLRRNEKVGLDSRWIDVLMAQFMQESSGLHVDLFQNFESKYGMRGKILSEEESIQQAVFYWLTLMDRAEQLGIRASRENILQSYNMGIGYLDYLDYHDSLTTEELAAGYSEEFLGGGGAPQYVSHVLRYLEMAKRSR